MSKRVYKSLEKTFKNFKNFQLIFHEYRKIKMLADRFSNLREDKIQIFLELELPTDIKKDSMINCTKPISQDGDMDSFLKPIQIKSLLGRKGSRMQLVL